MEPEQDAQSYTEGGDYGIDDTMLCEADHAQERFVMENDGDQSVDSDTSGDDAMIEENGHDEVFFTLLIWFYCFFFFNSRFSSHLYITC